MAIYFSVSHIQDFIESITLAGYTVNPSKYIHDKKQVLLSFNSNYSTEDIPIFSMALQIESDEYNKDEEEVEKGDNEADKYVLGQTKIIKILYDAMHGTGGTILGGNSLGGFGVSTKTPVGSVTPLNGS